MFNVGLYESRQYFFNTKRVLSYEKLYKLCKANENYSILPAQVSQQVLKSVNEAMKSFLALSKLEKAGKYPRPVHLPGYLPKDGYFGLTFPGQSITVKNGTFQIPMSRFFRKTYDEGERTILVSFPENLDPAMLKEVSIYPVGNGRAIKVSYHYQVNPATCSNEPKNILGIDLGLDNFASCISTTGTAFIMDGRLMKSINQFYNKSMAEQNKKDALCGVSGLTNRKLVMREKRNNRVYDIIYKMAKYILGYCMAHDIGTIVVGHNLSQKQSINLGKVNNRHFVTIPYARFRTQLAFLCEKNGIIYMETEESYTSKSSFLDKDPLPVYGSATNVSFSGKRVQRGLYRTGDGTLVNADLNGAANIIRKCYPEVADDVRFDGLSKALRSFPIRIRFRTLVKKGMGNYDLHQAS